MNIKNGDKMQALLKKIWKYMEMILKTILINILKLSCLENKWDEFIQFIQFGIVGLSNTFISYVSYLFFYSLGCHYLLASMLSFVVSVTNSFYWNNKYVFKENLEEKRSLIKTYIKTFVAYSFTGLMLANVLLYIWVQVLEISEVIAPLINLFVTIPVNFIINKYWAFGDSSR